MGGYGPAKPTHPALCLGFCLPGRPSCSLQRTRSVIIKHTQPADCGQEIRKSPSDGCGMEILSFFFFGLFILPSTWVFLSLEVIALIEPKDQQREADSLTENGKLKKKKKRRRWEELIPETWKQRLEINTGGYTAAQPEHRTEVRALGSL